MPLYYVLLNASDSIKSKTMIPLPLGVERKRFLLTVEADNEDAARALILDSFSLLSPEKDFGEVMVAQRHKNGWTLTLTD